MNADAPLRILMVEDVPRDADLATRELRRAGIDCETRVVAGRDDMLRALSDFKPEVILSDYAMPQFTGMDALHIRNEHAPATPFVVVTASINEETAVECIKQGADDYVTKQHLVGLVSAVRSAIEKKRLERVAKEAEDQVRRVAHEWRSTFDAMQEAVALLDSDLRIQRCNTALRAFLDRPWAAIIGQECCRAVHGFDTPPAECPALRARETLKRETWRTTVNDRWFDIVTDPVLDDEGQLDGLVHIMTDVTDRKGLEDRRALHARVLAVLNRANDWQHLLRDLLAELKRFTGFDAVGIRLKADEDYPYYVQDGFDAEFVRLENHLACKRDGAIQRDERGRPVLECTCGLVLSGQTPADHPLFTAGGSFWSNDTTPLLDLPAEQDPRNEPRNRCIHEGYKSVALIPLRAGDEIIGLLQLNDRRAGRFTADLITFFEEIGNSIGIAFTRQQTQQTAEEARTRLEMALRSSNVGLWDWDPKTGKVYFSPEWKAQIGYRDDELCGAYEEWESRIHPEDKERALTALTDYFEGHAPVYEVEFRLRHKDGSYRWIFAKGEAVRDEHGAPVRVLGCHLDVTDRKAAERAVREERDRAQRYLDIAGVMLVALDRDGVVTMINRKGREILGYPEEEIVGKKWFDHFLTPEVRRSVLRVHEALLEDAGDRGEYHENTVLTRSGEERLIAWHNVTLRNDAGQVTGHLSSGEDITEQRSMESRLRQAQKLESIGTLAGGVAHEINNPVMGIMNYAQLIVDKLGPDSDVAEFATEIGKETERVAAIVKNLLGFARQEKQAQSPARMCDVVESTLSLVRTVLRHDQITLNVDVPEDLPKLKCRSQQIQQVIMNLVTNARDALNEKYPGHDDNARISITARTIEKDGRKWIRTTVADTGPGIRDEVRERMFDPFYTTKPREKGTGLGLSISHGIVKDHGGEMSVESEAGEWTRFHVDLPVDNGWELGAERHEV